MLTMPTQIPWNPCFFFPYPYLCRTLCVPSPQFAQAPARTVPLPPLKPQLVEQIKREADRSVEKTQTKAESRSADKESTEKSEGSSPCERTAIEAKLDFILNSTNRPKLNQRKTLAHRMKKTPAQLAILELAVNGCKRLERKDIQTLSEKIGLSVPQVYKWLWESRKKRNRKEC